MIQKWKSNTEEFNINVVECELNCKVIALPVLTNLEVSSEETLIQIKYIYDKYFELINKMLGDRKTTINKLPYETILKLNFVAKMLYNYSLEIIDPDHKYDLYGAAGYVDISPSSTVPFCEYIYSAVIERINAIEEELTRRGLSIVQEDFSDTDWWS